MSNGHCLCEWEEEASQRLHAGTVGGGWDGNGMQENEPTISLAVRCHYRFAKRDEISENAPQTP